MDQEREELHGEAVNDTQIEAWADEAEAGYDGNDLQRVPCARCGVVGQLRIELREELVARPIGSFSLAGAQMKVSANQVKWPWMVCDACKAESRGKR